jgi:hypothetical protein
MHPHYAAWSAFAREGYIQSPHRNTYQIWLEISAKNIVRARHSVAHGETLPPRAQLKKLPDDVLDSFARHLNSSKPQELI